MDKIATVFLLQYFALNFLFVLGAVALSWCRGDETESEENRFNEYDRSAQNRAAAPATVEGRADAARNRKRLQTKLEELHPLVADVEVETKCGGTVQSCDRDASPLTGDTNDA